jgi:hypothetical protein
MSRISPLVNLLTRGGRPREAAAKVISVVAPPLTSDPVRSPYGTFGAWAVVAVEGNDGGNGSV